MRVIGTKITAIVPIFTISTLTSAHFIKNGKRSNKKHLIKFFLEFTTMESFYQTLKTQQANQILHQVGLGRPRYAQVGLGRHMKT